MTTFDKLANGNVKITRDGKITYLTDMRVKVYLGSGNTKLIIECFNDDIVIPVEEISEINSVAAPTDPELLAQKLLEDVFFLASPTVGGEPTTDASALTSGYLSESRNKPVTDIAAWGDSMTESFLGQTSYPSQLSALTGGAVFNMGIGGETSTQIKNRMVADTEKTSFSHIFWVGRNDMSADNNSGATIKSNLATMIAALGHTRYLVIGVCNKDIEPTGNATLTAINTLNSELSTLYGSKFIDIRAYLLTQGTGAGQDATDVSNGLIPSSLRLDGTHLNDSGLAKVAAKIFESISQLGTGSIAAKNSFTPQGRKQFDVAKEGKYMIGGIPVMYLPKQSAFTGSLVVGNGGKNLSHTSASEGFSNTIVGIQAGASVTTGSSNTLFGRYSGTALTTGSDNTVVGVNAMATSTAGTKNTSVGVSALEKATGNNNTAIGFQALYNQTTANDNTAVGLFALRANITGVQLVAVGSNALTSNTGVANTAVGYQCMMNQGTGGFNVAFGTGAGAGSAAYNASNNTLIGYRAGYALGTNGSSNVLIGYQAGDNVTTGAKNVIIGSDIDAPSATASNQLVIANVIFGQGCNGTGTTKAGTIGIGTDALSTATLALPAGTTTIAPANIPDGVAPTSPVNGDVWFVGDVMYRRIAGVTKSLTFA